MGPAWRQFVTLALLNLAIGSAHAQVASGTTTSSAAAATFTVDVGRADHVFRPDVVQANVGDIIQFNFFPPNHSVVRAEYGYPCIPYEKMVPGKQGFFSGFKPVDAILSSPPTYQVKINDTEPIFFYCSAPGSCIDWQMVGVINPVSQG
jgi:plastocyanin